MLFPLHQADPSALERLSTDLVTTNTTLSGLGDDLRAAGRRASGHTEGDLTSPVRQAVAPPGRDADELGRAALLGGGALSMWSEAVRAYETTVTGLNWRWWIAQQSGFGVADPVVPAGADADRRAQVEDQHDAEVSAARRELRRELTRLRDRALDELERTGDDAARLLDAGPTDATLKTLLLAGALPSTVLVDLPTVRLSDAEVARLRALLEQQGRLAEYFRPPPLGTSAATMRAQLELARRMGVDPPDYADLLRQYYVTKAAEKAGIDLTTWDVTRGAAAVSDHYERSYEYYAQLYLQHPYLRWAGMASMIGPSFAGGFEDIDMLRDLARDIDEAFPDGIPVSPGDVLPKGLDKLAEMSDAELAFYQQTFLTMQKDIFYDASMMHEAYLEGGLDSIEELQAAGLLDEGQADGEGAVQAWRDIDEGRRTGDTDLLDAGNTALLYREQKDTIGDEYDAMREHDPTGEVFTYGLGLIGRPSIPGAGTLGEHDGVDLDVDTNPVLPGVQGATVHTNIPEGNISDFDTRWDLIEHDTLPAYLDLVENDPDQVEDILTTDVRDRIDEQRLSEQWDDILATLTEVDVDVRAW